MKTIFDKTLQAELIKRINSINKNSKAQWGKMNICQMLKHCTYWEQWMLGVNTPVYKQNIIGKIFGKMALQKMTKDDNPLDKNVPTSKEFKMKNADCDVEAEKTKWINLIQQYEYYNNPAFIHIFFGRMTKEQVGILAYKHTDHHLRQFGA